MHSEFVLGTLTKATTPNKNVNNKRKIVEKPRDWIWQKHDVSLCLWVRKCVCVSVLLHIGVECDKNKMLMCRRKTNLTENRPEKDGFFLLNAQNKHTPILFYCRLNVFSKMQCLKMQYTLLNVDFWDEIVKMKHFLDGAHIHSVYYYTKFAVQIYFCLCIEFV